MARKRKESKTWKFITRAAVIIGILGSLAEFFNFINIIPNKSDKILQLTVRVFEKGDRSKIIKNGIIRVDIGHRRDSMPLGSGGEVDFEEIGVKFLNEKIDIQLTSSDYQLTHPDSFYIFTGEPIYLTVEKKSSLGFIKGIVKSEDGALLLDGVRVLINSEHTVFSDSLGIFYFQMPANQIADRYTIRLDKEGYRHLEEYYYPNSNGDFRLSKLPK